MKLRKLEIELEDVADFQNPKVSLEQYSTTSHLAASMIHTAESQFNDISEKTVIDLGCGCGKLAIAATIMGSQYTLGVDVDKDAIEIFNENLELIDDSCNTIDIILADICKPEFFNIVKEKSFDTAILNPPFGIDMQFLYIASRLAKNAIYSLHKTSTRDHVLKKANDFGLSGNVIAELRYNLSSTYKFHKKQSKDIQVDFIRFAFK